MIARSVRRAVAQPGEQTRVRGRPERAPRTRSGRARANGRDADEHQRRAPARPWCTRCPSRRAGTRRATTRYCTISGRSRPSSARLASTASCDASRPRMRRATSPGITLVRREHDDRRQRQRDGAAAEHAAADDLDARSPAVRPGATSLKSTNDGRVGGDAGPLAAVVRPDVPPDQSVMMIGVSSFSGVGDDRAPASSSPSSVGRRVVGVGGGVEGGVGVLRAVPHRAGLDHRDDELRRHGAAGPTDEVGRREQPRRVDGLVAGVELVGGPLVELDRDAGLLQLLLDDDRVVLRRRLEREREAHRSSPAFEQLRRPWRGRCRAGRGRSARRDTPGRADGRCRAAAVPLDSVSLIGVPVERGRDRLAHVLLVERRRVDAEGEHGDAGAADRVDGEVRDCSRSA